MGPSWIVLGFGMDRVWVLLGSCLIPALVVLRLCMEPWNMLGSCLGAVLGSCVDYTLMGLGSRLDLSWVLLESCVGHAWIGLELFLELVWTMRGSCLDPDSCSAFDLFCLASAGIGLRSFLDRSHDQLGCCLEIIGLCLDPAWVRLGSCLDSTRIGLGSLSILSLVLLKSSVGHVCILVLLVASLESAWIVFGCCFLHGFC